MLPVFKANLTATVSILRGITTVQMVITFSRAVFDVINFPFLNFVANSVLIVDVIDNSAHVPV